MQLYLLFNTGRYLRPVQLIYQVLYRLIKVKRLTAYQQPRLSIAITALAFSDFLPVIECADDKGCFFFLNQEGEFKDNLDWQYALNGKLWNYNLQYANYLLQDNIRLSKRLAWLADLHTQLLNGNLLLEPYPVSLRSINIIRLICKEKINDESVCQNLYAQLNFLSKRFEYHLLGNHLLENAFALLMGGAFFDNNRWKDKAYQVLEEELNEQILFDGAHFELSAMYHQIILYRLLELIDWYTNYNKKKEGFLEFIKLKASKMLAWLKNITFSNNDIPAFNDCAPGIAYETRQLVQYADRLNISTMVKLPLSDSGYRMYYNGNYQCAIDVASIGPAYQAGHGHADALSFILYYKNNPIFVEAGTSTYNEGLIRAFERSTNAHNSVVVNGRNSSCVWGSFRVGNRANVDILNESSEQVIATHDGYKRDFKVIHKRAFEFSSSKILICDELIGGKVKESKAYFHLHPSIKYTLAKERIFIENVGSITFSGAIKLATEEFGYASGFNKICKSTVIEVTFDRALQTQIGFL